MHIKQTFLIKIVQNVFIKYNILPFCHSCKVCIHGGYGLQTLFYGFILKEKIK